MKAPPPSRPSSARPSFPSGSGEPALRRLGVGSAAADRPVRAQIVVAIVVALALVAVPLYLMRRPSPTRKAEALAASASAAPPPSAGPSQAADAGKPSERLRLGAPQRVRCGASPKGGQEGNLCDQLAPLEEALQKAIRENEACALRVKEPGSINFVMNVDFVKKAVHVFPGASGDFRGPQARKVTNCVKRGLPKLEWDSIRHQFRYYTVAVLATYAPEGASNTSGNGSSPATPKFD